VDFYHQETKEKWREREREREFWDKYEKKNEDKRRKESM
jgi:hypothetical protein